MSPELQLARGFVREFPTEAAAALEGMEVPSAVALLAECPAEEAATLLPVCAPGFGADCLEAWPQASLSALLTALGDATLARLGRRLSGSGSARVLAALPEERRRRLEALSSYPAGSAGALMDPRAPALTSGTTVAEARRRLRPYRDAGIRVLYVVGDAARPEGVVGLARLAVAEAHETLAELASELPARIPPLAPARSLAAHPAWGAARELPVVDDELGLVGIVRLEAVERLEVDEGSVTHPAVSMTLALGELYWHMASSLLGAAGAAPSAREDDER